MAFTKLSDDYGDDCWQLSDAAFRLHTEALIWQARRLLDCRIPKSDLRHLKRGEPAVVQELLARGFWSDYGDSYVILHHSQYQRTRESVVAQQTRNQMNGKKGGRRPSSGGAREVWPRPVATPTPTQMGTQNETQSETQLGLRGFQGSETAEMKFPVNTRDKNPDGNPLGNPEGMAFKRSSTPTGPSEIGVNGPLALDPDAWPTDEEGLRWRIVCEDKNVMTVEGLMAVCAELKTENQARNALHRAYPGRVF
ncbi:hypothetical protein FBY33_3632 [Arthrobacter sp. SLBN-112]|uniref:hypothetical protein n=1 Tax=Arthrobacter sp. SLBN-112 TaxID=2768452 RepID=UPI0011534722|nr:hypothetical protein [Arthrobacter sp. SLBN-112]TQJ41517.1 hypothetical protein FBY33_3632 [Arthrobacter sp. SLBN-112]